jgi:RES domain
VTTGSLSGFPARTWKAGRPLWRIHRAVNDAWWFNADGTGRFDPVHVAGLGACYLAQDRLGAFVEAFRTRLELDQDDIDERRIARVELSGDLRLADAVSRRALGFGVTAEIGAGGENEYDRSQELASGLAAAGYKGIRWWVRHDPAQRLVGIALFGSAGVVSSGSGLSPAESRGIDRSLLDEARRKFGYRVVPRP